MKWQKEGVFYISGEIRDPFGLTDFTLWKKELLADCEQASSFPVEMKGCVCSSQMGVSRDSPVKGIPISASFTGNFRVDHNSSLYRSYFID